MLSASAIRWSPAACRFNFCSMKTKSTGFKCTGTRLSAHMMLEICRMPTSCQGSHLLVLKTSGKSAQAMNIKLRCLSKASLTQHTAGRQLQLQSHQAGQQAWKLQVLAIQYAVQAGACIAYSNSAGLEYQAWHVKQDINIFSTCSPRPADGSRSGPA